MIEVVQKGYELNERLLRAAKGHCGAGAGLNCRAGAPSRRVSVSHYLILELPHG